MIKAATSLLLIFLSGFSFTCIAQSAPANGYSELPKPIKNCPPNSFREILIIDAIKNGRYDQFISLIDGEKNFELKEGKTCVSLVSLSVIHMNYDIFTYLLKNGFNHTSYDSWGNPACYAALYGRAEYLKDLLDKGVSPDTRTVFGSTLLHFAVKEGKYETVELLIKHQADMKIRNEDGLTVLESARKQKADKMIDVLTKAGTR